MAFSDKISDKSYKYYRLKKRFLPLLITLTVSSLFAVAAVKLDLIGEVRGIIAVVILFAVLFIVTGAKRAFDTDYDGVVTDKRIFRTAMDAEKYIIIVKDDRGRLHKYSVMGDNGKLHGISMSIGDVKDDSSNHPHETFFRKADAIEYFRRGDRVRHHAGMKLFEKEDKSKDKSVLCCGCLALTEKNALLCRNCGLPLLK